MNAFITLLNNGGRWVADFGWPMLVQSSLLIAMLYLLDGAIRRRGYAALRYALWMLLLIKLLLPPSLALPTGILFWLPGGTWGAEIAPAIVSGNISLIALDPAVPVTSPAAPAARLTLAACLFLAWVVGGLSLAAWLAGRWRHVSGLINRALPADQQVNDRLKECREQAGLRRPVTVLLSNDLASPVVCGLRRPVVLLPAELVRSLTAVQLRSLLLHEIIHLKRGDVWVSHAQSCLQLIYWWHPLVWWANSRIRRVREEAVDETVMALTGDDRELYPTTLIIVARHAFSRPLLTLGLLGVLESKSALKQRIEYMLRLSVPHQVNLGFAGYAAVLAIGMLTLPMARGERDRGRVDSPRLAFANRAEQAGQARPGKPVPAVVVNIQVLTGSAAEFNRLNASPVRAIPAELQRVERAAAKLNLAPAQVLIEAKLADISERTYRRLLANKLSVVRGAQTGARILASAEFRTLLRELEQSTETDILSAPRMITLSGRAAKIQITQATNVFTGINPKATIRPGVSTMNREEGALVTSAIELGPVLDVTPVVNADQSAIQMPVSVVVTEFFGYDRSWARGNETRVWIDGKEQKVREPRPRIQRRRLESAMEIPDGQTLLLCNMARETGNTFGNQKRLVAFVTATIIDSTGNPIAK